MASDSRSWITVPGVPLAALPVVMLAASATGQGLSRVAELRSLDELRGAKLANATEDLGRVEDLSVDLGDGSIVSLILSASTSSGQRTVEVPFELVTWSGTAGSFLADMPKSELDAMPNFRSEEFALFGETGKNIPAGMAPPQVASGRMLATELSALRARFLGGEEDKLRGLTIELFTGELAFVTVSSVEGASMANLHALPWKAVCVFGVSPAPGREPTPEACLRIDRTRLAEAPSLRDGQLGDPDFRAAVYRFHHVTMPGFETLH